MTNFFAYSVQVAVLIGVGALLPKLARLHNPRAYLIYCQTLLAICFLLPLLQPWQRQNLVAAGAESGTVRIDTGRVSPETKPVDWENAGLAVLGGGALIRAGWLCLGLLRLRTYRRRGMRLDPVPGAVSAAERLTGTSAAFGSAEGNGPVTFGWRRPVVLLPGHFGDLSGEAQLAIATHELIHVRRRDWLVLLFEEVASVALWFHPAVWWLLARIRLTREQAVDQEVVSLLGAREPYVDCLLAMAGAPPRLDLAPAPLFLRRRHLSQRIRSLLEEVTLSKSRIASVYAGAAVMLALAVKVSILLFPLTGQAQVAEDSAGVQVEAGAKLLYRSPVIYPSAARSRRIEGAVVVDLTLAKDGTVADARVVSGPDELRKAALASVLEWHYDASAAPQRVAATIDFRIAAPRSQSGPVPVLARIDLDALPADLRESLRIRLAPFAGERLTAEANREIHSILAANRIGNIVWRKEDSGNVVLSVTSEGVRQPVAAAAEFEPPANGTKRIRVGGNVQSAKLISQARPEYPALAKQARIQGTVRFSVLIAKDGTVKGLLLIAGHPLLVESAQKAVQQWKYQPTHLNGEPVEVVTVVDVNYTLAE